MTRVAAVAIRRAFKVRDGMNSGIFKGTREMLVEAAVWRGADRQEAHETITELVRADVISFRGLGHGYLRWNEEKWRRQPQPVLTAA